MPTGPEATALRSDPPKKALCHTHPVGRTYDKYRLFASQLDGRVSISLAVTRVNVLTLQGQKYAAYKQ